MMSRLSELNALVKSNFTNTWSDLIDLMKRRVACTAASQPPGTAMPSCTGVKWADSLATARLFAHLAAHLLHKYPIAMGLRPPESLLRAIKLPPKNRSYCGRALAAKQQVGEICHPFSQRQRSIPRPHQL